MKRSIIFWIYFGVAILLAIYFGTRLIMTGLGISPISIVRSVYISADTPNKDLSFIANAVGIAPGTDTYELDLEAINTRINAVPGVRKSAVRRKPDGNISIKVNLYKAIAIWTDGEMYYPLSADGTIVKKPTTERPEGNILFYGSVPKDISQITKVAENLGSDLNYLEWIENRRWNLHTTGGITVLLPEKDPYSAIGNLIILNKNHGILSKDLKIIDMRDESRILVR